jgi:hypothetical protein
MKIWWFFVSILLILNTTITANSLIKDVLPSFIDRTAWGLLIVGYGVSEYKNWQKQKEQKIDERELVRCETSRIILNRTSLISVDGKRAKKSDIAWEKMLEESSTISGIYLLARLLKELYFPT